MPIEDTLHRVQRIDAACDRFEAAWHEELKPRLEDYLASVPESQREQLFAELLAIEIEMRATTTEPATREALLDRFPTYAQIVRTVFESPPDDVAPRYIELPCRWGNYDLHQWLGQGSQARVYRGRDRATNRDVALKVLDRLAGLPAADRQSFLADLARAKEFQHPAICPLLDVGEEDGTPFVVMPLLTGLTLADVLQFRSKPLPESAARQLSEQIAAAVRAAHGHGLVHGNLHPGNVFLTKEPASVVVMDLGLPLAPFGKLSAAATTFRAPGLREGSALRATPASDDYAMTALHHALWGKTKVAP